MLQLNKPGHIMTSTTDSKTAQVISRIKRLSSLDIDGTTLAPALLDTLHGLVPSYSNCLVRLKPDFDISYIYDENPDSAGLIPLYAQEYFDTRECQVMTGFSQAAKTELGVTGLQDALKVSSKAYYQHDFYNEIFRPMGYRDFIRVTLREAGTPVGVLSLHRSKNDPQFTPKDRYQLNAIAPFLAFALNKTSEVTTQTLVDSDESAMIIANCRGQILSISHHAEELLRHAFHPQLPSQNEQQIPKSLAGLVNEACRHLKSMNSDNGPKTPPIWHFKNPLGGFTFKAYWLSGSSCQNGGDIMGITIQRQIPKQLKMVKQLERFGLTDRQFEVAMLMLEGHSRTKIAKKLNVSAHTVVYHCREIYSRLGINSREELSGKLLVH